MFTTSQSDSNVHTTRKSTHCNFLLTCFMKAFKIPINKIALSEN